MSSDLIVVFSFLFIIVLFVTFLLTLNFWINVEDVCSKKCHDDYKRKIILFLIIVSIVLVPLNSFIMKLDQFQFDIMIIALATINNILQFIYLRQLKNDCKCDKSFVMDMIRIINYFNIFILLPSTYISIYYQMKLKSS